MSDRYSATLWFGPWYRKSPYFEATRRAGCTAYDIYNHMYLPSYYDDPEVEYRALLERVTLWDVGVERIVQISGPDALPFTDMLTCRDLTRCRPWQGKYAPLLAPDGGIINDPVLLRVGEDRFWLCLADSDAGLWAQGIAWGAGMDVEVTEPDVFPVQVQGLRAKDTMAKLFGDEVMSLRYYWCAETSLDDIPVVVSRTGWTGEVGYEVYLQDPSRGEDLWDRIMEAGAEFDIRPVAPVEARRIEAGIFNYGSDITASDTPLHVMGMERLVEDSGADYIGKDALERLRSEGVRHRVVGIEVDGDPLESEMPEVRPALQGERVVGQVTALIHSPRLDRNIGYVRLPAEMSEPGTELEVDLIEGRRTGRTAAIPFVDPQKKTPAA